MGCILEQDTLHVYALFGTGSAQDIVLKYLKNVTGLQDSSLCSYLVGLLARGLNLDRVFIYILALCVQAVKALARLHVCTGFLVPDLG